MLPNTTKITVGVSGHWILGTLSLPDARVQEVLNDTSTAYIELDDVEVHAHMKRDCVARRTTVVIPKGKIEYVIVPTTKHEAPDKRRNNRTSKEEFSAFAIVSAHGVEGTLHLSNSLSDNRSVLRHQLNSFFAFTDATVYSGGKGDKPLRVPLLLANKEFVSCLDIGPRTSRQVPQAVSVSHHCSESAADRDLSTILDSVRSLLEAPAR